MIRPAVYCLAISGVIHAENTCCMKIQASNAMLNGLTSQLTNSVTSRPLGRRAIPPIAPKSTFSIIG